MKRINNNNNKKVYANHTVRFKNKHYGEMCF